MPIRKPRTNNWPPRSHLFAYECSDGEWGVVADSKDSKYDLDDNLSHILDAGRPLRLGIKVENSNWPVWDEDSLAWMESRIVWDFAFDGDDVELTRITPERGERPCSEEFVWQIDRLKDSAGQSPSGTDGQTGNTGTREKI